MNTFKEMDLKSDSVVSTEIYPEQSWKCRKNHASPLATDRALPTRIPTRTRVSSDARPLIKRSLSHCTTPFSKSKTIVDPPVNDILNWVLCIKGQKLIPNAKYPNSWPRLTWSPSSTVVTILPTIIAPMHTAKTRPKIGLSMGTILRAFSP